MYYSDERLSMAEVYALLRYYLIIGLYFHLVLFEDSLVQVN